MAGTGRLFNPSTLYVESRRAEIEALALEIHRARQATAGRRLRHRLG